MENLATEFKSTEKILCQIQKLNVKQLASVTALRTTIRVMT